MALRKQPDRQVKKKLMRERPENLDMTKRKRKLEEPRVEKKFKMVLRKQPDRQVKKMRKLELEEQRNVDIIGTLVCSYGMTGENLVRKMFSYLDVSSLQGGHLVCKTWNFFLVNDKRLWLDILRRTHTYFEIFSEQDENFTTDAERQIWKRYTEKSDEKSCHKIIQVFKRLQMIHITLQDVIQDCPGLQLAFPVHEVFQKEFIGEKLSREIKLQIDTTAEKAKLPKCNNHFNLKFAKLLDVITLLKVSRDQTRCQKEAFDIMQLLHLGQEFQNVYQGWLEACRNEQKSSKRLLISSVRITLFAAYLGDVCLLCIDV